MVPLCPDSATADILAGWQVIFAKLFSQRGGVVSLEKRRCVSFCLYIYLFCIVPICTDKHKGLQYLTYKYTHVYTVMDVWPKFVSALRAWSPRKARISMALFIHIAVWKTGTARPRITTTVTQQFCYIWEKNAFLVGEI